MKTQSPLTQIQEMVSACMQCGTCTGSCVNAFAMDMTPRHLWRLVLMGDLDAVFQSKTFALCSACYYCSLRCPRGLPLTEAMAALKRAAVALNAPVYQNSAKFNQAFLHNVQKNGRIQELEFMTAYFLARGNPFLPLQFAPLGTKLLWKKKIGFSKPATARSPALLESLFQKVEELEKP